MKCLPLSLLFLITLACPYVQGQPTQGSGNSSLDLTGAAGISNYYGDLTENAHLFNQSSYAVTLGAAYNFARKLNARLDFSILKLQANDSRNKRVDLQARNLNFKSNIWDLNAGIGYDILDIQTHKFTPNIYAGFGIFHFNPYTKDRFGEKQYLQPWGTEGQGIAAYPDRKPYKLTEFEWLLGLGFKYALNSKIVLELEFRYRYATTDYIDDVSRYSYPDKTLLEQKNINLPKLTYRGDELPGGDPYPTNPGLNRGHSNRNDVFYTTQFKIAYRLKNFIPGKIKLSKKFNK